MYMTRVRAFQFEAKARNGVGFMPLSLSSHTARINPPASNTPPLRSHAYSLPAKRVHKLHNPESNCTKLKATSSSRWARRARVQKSNYFRHTSPPPPAYGTYKAVVAFGIANKVIKMDGVQYERVFRGEQNVEGKVMRNRSILIGVKGTLYNRWRREIILDRTYSVNRLTNLLGIFLSDITLQGVLRVKQHLFHLLHLPPSIIVCPSSYCRGLRFVVVCR